MYALQYDREVRTLGLRLTGFWSEQTMADFVSEFVPLVDKLRRIEPRFVILSDCRSYPVQSTETMVAWSRLLGTDTQITMPYAVVVGTVLNKIQGERGLTAPNVKIFVSLDAATEWLRPYREP